MRGGFGGSLIGGGGLHRSQWPELLGQVQHRRRASGRWPRPLQSTRIDTFLASQSDRFFAIDGTLTDGISWVPTTVDGMPAYDIVPGELGLGMIRASHSFWSSCVEAGLDQVIDDVWVIPE